MKEGSAAWKLANFAGLQLAWFACVLGAAHDLVWAGWLVGLAFVAFRFAWIRARRPDAILAAAALLLGGAYETLNRGAGVHTTTTDVFPAPAPPSWLLLRVAFGIQWGIALPLLFWLAERAQRGGSPAASAAADRGGPVTSPRAG